MHAMSIPDKIIKAKLVRAAIQANATVFTNATAVLTSFTNAITALETASNSAGDGGKTLTALMRQREREFDQVMQQVANYVENTANGNPAIIILASLDVMPHGSHHSQGFEAKQGESGTVHLRTPAEKGSVYIWEYSGDNATWTEHDTGTRSYTRISGLSPGTRYWFRVARIDKDGRHPFSEAISMIVV
jgi:hypothetical protein